MSCAARCGLRGVKLLASLLLPSVGLAQRTSYPKSLEDATFVLRAATSPQGTVRRLAWRMIIHIDRVNGDSLVGTYAVDVESTQNSGGLLETKMQGRVLPDRRVALFVRVHDDSTLDLFLGGTVKADTLFLEEYRPRIGASVVPPGYRLVLVRDSSWSGP